MYSKVRSFVPILSCRVTSSPGKRSSHTNVHLSKLAVENTGLVLVVDTPRAEFDSSGLGGTQFKALIDLASSDEDSTDEDGGGQVLQGAVPDAEHGRCNSSVQFSANVACSCV